MARRCPALEAQAYRRNDGRLDSIWLYRPSKATRQWPLKPIVHFNRRGQMQVMYRLLPRRHPVRFYRATWRRVGRPPHSTNWGGQLRRWPCTTVLQTPNERSAEPHAGRGGQCRADDN